MNALIYKKVCRVISTIAKQSIKNLRNFKVADYADNYRLSFEEDSYSGDAG